MKCFNCGCMQMIRCKHTGGIHWICPNCNSITESTSNSNDDSIAFTIKRQEEDKEAEK